MVQVFFSLVLHISHDWPIHRCLLVVCALWFSLCSFSVLQNIFIFSLSSTSICILVMKVMLNFPSEAKSPNGARNLEKILFSWHGESSISLRNSWQNTNKSIQSWGPKVFGPCQYSGRRPRYYTWANNLWFQYRIVPYMSQA